MSTAIQIPNSDLADFARLPRPAQRDVQWWLSIIKKVDKSKKKCATVESLSAVHGVSTQTIHRKRGVYNRLGWRGLVNRAKNPVRPGSLPKAFIAAWKIIYKSHQRDQTGKEAHNKLIQQWEAWRAGDHSQKLPGYKTPPAPMPRTGIPRGWSHRNLMRKLTTKHERALERIGSGRANDHVPSVYLTRVGLQVGQVFMIDDQVYDVDVAFPGMTNETFRPLGLNMLDLFSGFDSSRGFKPVLRNAEGKREMLKEKETLWLVMTSLMDRGYRQDIGTTIVGEHGTAVIRKPVADALQIATNNKVTISTSGLIGKAVHGLVFEGQSRGNFKFKAARESWFNALRNRMSALPAPTGLNRDHAPQEQFGINRYTRNLLKAADSLPEELRAHLITPTLNWTQFLQAAYHCSESLNDRTEHAMEGWEKAGLMAHEWRLSIDQPWLPIERLNMIEDPAQRGAMEALIKAPGCYRIRRLSPREVFHSQSHKLTKLSPFLLNTILPADMATPVTVNKKHEIIVKDREIDPEPLRYHARVLTASNRTELITPGTELRLYLNPYNPATILVCDSQDAAIGLADQIIPPHRLDERGVLRQVGKVAQIRSELSIDARERAKGEAAHRQALVDHNKRIIAGEETDPHKRRQAGAKKAAETRHSNKVNKRAQEVDTAEALDAWATPPEQPEVTEDSSPVNTDAFNPFTD